MPVLEQQLLGLMWRGGKIDHQPGEHDDYANAAAGVVQVITAASVGPSITTASWVAHSDDDEDSEFCSYWGAVNQNRRLTRHQPR
jgi:hypothetical protein